jgi:N-terminal acetyltransferase B complex non-catalytic subunit
VLEAAYGYSPHNATLRLSLTSVYGLLGAAAAAAVPFESLGVKHIQLDTLTHHLLPALLGGGQWAKARRLADDVRGFHAAHERDAPDTILMAYDAGTYTKVLEFVGLLDRLGHSHTRAAAVLELQLQRVRETYAMAPAADMPAVLEVSSLMHLSRCMVRRGTRSIGSLFRLAE